MAPLTILKAQARSVCKKKNPQFPETAFRIWFADDFLNDEGLIASGVWHETGPRRVRWDNGLLVGIARLSDSESVVRYQALAREGTAPDLPEAVWFESRSHGRGLIACPIHGPFLLKLPERGTQLGFR